MGENNSFVPQDDRRIAQMDFLIISGKNPKGILEVIHQADLYVYYLKIPNLLISAFRPPVVWSVGVGGAFIVRGDTVLRA